MPVDEHSRPDKLDHAQTVLYEIDVLRHSKNRLAERNFQCNGDEWLVLEAFLLHYRNLIEFFSGRANRGTDLSIAKPQDIWPDTLKRPSPDVLITLHRPDLLEKYDTTDNLEAISKYLQHCTTHRVSVKKWDVGRMYDDLLPVLEKFELLLPEYKPATAKSFHITAALSGDGNSTTTTRVVTSPWQEPTS